MTDTNAVAADTEEQGSAVTSCTLYDRSSAAAGPKAKYAFLNLRSVEETSNCVAFDGVYLKANALKVRFSQVSLCIWVQGLEGAPVQLANSSCAALTKSNSMSAVTSPVSGL